MARLGLRVVSHVLPISLPWATSPTTTPQLAGEQEPSTSQTMVVDADGPRSPVTANTFGSPELVPTMMPQAQLYMDNEEEETKSEAAESGDRSEKETRNEEKDEAMIYPTRIEEVGGDERGTRVELEGTEPYAEDFDKVEEEMVDKRDQPLHGEKYGTADRPEGYEQSSLVEESGSDERGTRVDQSTKPEGNQPDVHEQVGGDSHETSADVGVTKPHLEDIDTSHDKGDEDHTITEVPTTASFLGASVPPLFVESPLVSRAHAQQQPTSLMEEHESEPARTLKVHDLSTASACASKEQMMGSTSTNDHVRSPSPVQQVQGEGKDVQSSSHQRPTIESSSSEVDPLKEREEKTPQLDTPIASSSDVWAIGFSSDEEMSDMDEDDTLDLPSITPSYLQQNIVKAVYYAIGQ